MSQSLLLGINTFVATTPAEARILNSGIKNSYLFFTIKIENSLDQTIFFKKKASEFTFSSLVNYVGIP
nr:hypothetical protein [Fischerella sp. PCC 9605]